jgi:ribosome-binding factor A
VVKRASHRPEQVAETVRQVIAEVLARDVRDPRVQRVTVTGVRVSADLSHATVRVVVGEGSEPERALEGLESAAGYLRSRVAKTLTTRVVPELAFEIDRGLEQAHRIDALLNSLRRTEDGGV